MELGVENEVDIPQNEVPNAMEIGKEIREENGEKLRLESAFIKTVDQSKGFKDKSNINTLINQFDQLIQLQSKIPVYPDTFWGMEILLSPIITKFKYHFVQLNKETNKLSKPEWALQFIENYLDENLTILQFIVDDTFKKINRIGTFEIITTLLKPLREKFSKSIQLINSNLDQEDEKYGRLLSHLIFELNSFDQRILNKYQYNPYMKSINDIPQKKWQGLTSDILLQDSSATENWINFERKLAIKRLQNELISPDAFKIDHDYKIQGLKPTFSSFGLIKLINNLNTHFETLNIVKYQLKFVSKVQLYLIDLYFDSISLQYKQFLDKFNFKNILNIIPGSIEEDVKRDEPRIFSSLVTLTELYCSVKFTSNAIEEWNNQLIFIQLWQTFQKLNSNEEEDDGIFDNSVRKFDELLSKLFNNFNDFFKHEIKQLLKTYINSSSWVLLDASMPNINLTNFLQVLPNYLDFLEKNISKYDYYLITNRIVSNICNLLYEYILVNNKFNKVGINQFLIDFNYIIKNLHRHLYLNSVEGAEFNNDENPKYIKLVQAIDLLDSIEPETAQSTYKSEELVSRLRLQYEHKLGELTNYDIKSLLARLQNI